MMITNTPTRESMTRTAKNTRTTPTRVDAPKLDVPFWTLTPDDPTPTGGTRVPPLVKPGIFGIVVGTTFK